jgi:hypothetical protein
MTEPADLPQPPDEPHPDECCGRGCCPCIFDYYRDALERWKKVVRDRGGDSEAMLKALGR